MNIQAMSELSRHNPWFKTSFSIQACTWESPGDSLTPNNLNWSLFTAQLLWLCLQEEKM